jgi:hypothetical protein
MRTSTLACVAAFLAIAPASASAAWPPGGLQVAYPYQYHRDGRLVHDGTGDILSMVHNTGHGNWWIVNRVTPNGDYAAGWAASGIGLYNDGASAAVFATAIDGSGGLWHVQHFTGSTSSDVVLDHVTSTAEYEPSGSPPWNVAATSAQEFHPAVERDGGTGAFVAWWRNFSQLYLQRMTANGLVEAGWPAAGKLLLGDFQFAEIRPTMLADGAGGVLVLANAYGGLYLFRVDGAGAVPAGWSDGLQLDAGGATTADLIRADASHVFAVWTVDGRVVSQLVPIASTDPDWPGSPLELFSASQGPSQLDVVSDGAGGLHALCRTADEGARWQHVGANGQLASGFATGGLSPVDGDAVLVATSLGPAGRIFGATGKDGGLIATWRDLRAGGAGARARWLRADGTPDPAEPAAGRLVAADADPYAAYVLAALEDGEGGAYVLWSADARLPYWSTAYVTRAFASDVLDAGRPTGPALELSIGPNPARDLLTVHATLPLAGSARLALHDLAGRLVAAREIQGAGRHVERLGDLGTLAPGLYVVSIAQGKSVRSARVAVIR